MEQREWRGTERPRLLTTVTALRQDRGLGAWELSHRMGMTLREYRNLEEEPEKMTKLQQEQLARFLEFDPDKFVFMGTKEEGQGWSWPELFFYLNLAIGLLLLGTNLAAKIAFLFVNR